MIIIIIVTLAVIEFFGISLSKQTLLDIKHHYFCVGEGESGSHFKKHKCCKNLKAVAALSFVVDEKAKDYGERCLTSGAGGHFLCTKCGNGICENIENACNCPEDCFNK